MLIIVEGMRTLIYEMGYEVANHNPLLTCTQIIMIHRSFLLRSFGSPLLLFTRNTCVSAAITILRELELIEDEGCLPIWTHAAYCINAAIILCLHIQHSSPSDEKCVRYREMVLTAQARLRRMKSDDMSSRGLNIIESLLTYEQSSRNTRGITNQHSSPWSASRASGSYGDTTSEASHLLGGFLNLENTLSVSTRAMAGENDVQLGSFEDWFAHAFGVTSGV